MSLLAAIGGSTRGSFARLEWLNSKMVRVGGLGSVEFCMTYLPD